MVAVEPIDGSAAGGSAWSRLSVSQSESQVSVVTTG